MTFLGYGKGLVRFMYEILLVKVMKRLLSQIKENQLSLDQVVKLTHFLGQASGDARKVVYIIFTF